VLILKRSKFQRPESKETLIASRLPFKSVKISIHKIFTKGGAELTILYVFMKPLDDDTSNMGIYLQIIEKPIV